MDSPYRTALSQRSAFVPANEGAYIVRLTVTDDDGLSGTEEAVVTVGNAAPQDVDAGPDLFVWEGQSVELDVHFNDPGRWDSHTFVWSVWSDNGQVIPDRSRVELRLHPRGQRHVRRDGDGNRRPRCIIVGPGCCRRRECGTWPGDCRQRSRGGRRRSGPIAKCVRRSGFRDSHTVLWEVVADNGDVVGASHNSTFQFRPADNGTYTVTLTVTDNSGDTGQDTVVVTVNNVAPQNVSAGPDRRAYEDEEIHLAGYFHDPGGLDTYTYHWSATADNGQQVLDSTDTSFTFLPVDNGVYTVTLTVMDDDGGAASNTCVVTMQNVAPKVNLGPDIEVTEGDVVTLDGELAVSDSGQDTHTYQWQIFSDNGQSVQGGTGSLFSFSPIDDGTYLVRLTATDDDGQSGYDNLIVSARNMPPQNLTFQWSILERNSGSEMTATGSFADLGADTWRASIDYGDGTRMPLALADRAFSGRHVYRSAGAYQVTVVVTDDDQELGSYTTQVDTSGTGNPYPFHHLAMPCDVSGDGVVSPIDALLVINHLNQFGAGPLPSPTLKTPPPYLDVVPNGYVLPIDALFVINFLNSRTEGEGETGEVVPSREMSPSIDNDLRGMRDEPGPVPGTPAPAVVPVRLTRSSWILNGVSRTSFTASSKEPDVSRHGSNRDALPEKWHLPCVESPPPPTGSQIEAVSTDLVLSNLADDLALEGLLDEITADIAHAWEATGHPRVR